MQAQSRLMLTVLTAATLLVSLVVGSASARRFELSEQRVLAIWTSLEFTLGEFSPMLCPVTLEGSFHSRTLSKVSGQLVGYVTATRLNGALCTNGSATILSATVPWHVRYDSFRGTLPAITGILLQLVRFQVRISDPLGFSCLSEGTAGEPVHVILQLTSGVGRTLRADETRGISCRFLGSLRLRGTAEVFVQNAPGLETVRVTVRLVQ
jgi:hypothetical protein